MALKVYKSTDFTWTKEFGGEADVSELVKDTKFTEPPKEFYITDYHSKPPNPKFKLKFALDHVEMDPDFKDVVSAWHYKAPYQAKYSDLEGAEITVFNI